MSDQIFYGADARERVLNGAQLLYEAVKTTMGPKGQNVVIGKGMIPTVTHDGVTVAKSFNVEDDPMGQKAGAELIKQAADKMNSAAGDGTTTVTVLTYHLLAEANKLITAGYSPMVLRTELEEASAEAVNSIHGTPVKGDLSKMADVAYISCGDLSLGQLVAEAVHATGQDGVVTIESTQERGTTKSIVDGFTLEKGMFSPYFTLDQARQESVYQSPAVLLISGKLYDIQEIVPILEQLQKAQKQLVIFAEEFAADVIANLILNKVKGSFVSCAVVINKPQLEDLSAVTGGQVFGQDSGRDLVSFTMDDIGGAHKIVVNQKETTIVNGNGDIKPAIKSLDKAIEEAKSEYEKEEHQRHKAQLQGKVAVIKVGGMTETETEEKKFRVDDAVHAVKAALEDGIVPGGGTTLVEVANQLELDTNGAKILKQALRQPFLILCENAGLEGKVYLANGLKTGEGVDVRNGKTVPLMKSGIIDPAAVTKQAIENAVSVAGTAMTMGALIIEQPEEPKPGMPPQMQIPMG